MRVQSVHALRDASSLGLIDRTKRRLRVLAALADEHCVGGLTASDVGGRVWLPSGFTIVIRFWAIRGLRVLRAGAGICDLVQGGRQGLDLAKKGPGSRSYSVFIRVKSDGL